MRLTKYNTETGLYEYNGKAKTWAEYNDQRKAVIQKLGEYEDKSSDLAEEIFAEIENINAHGDGYYEYWKDWLAKLAELKKKYTEEGK